ncbi:MAG: hypothetical protein GZ088_09770 [Acidipila sp.]|nr:hypothetical protein [Acidipila sp.]
MNAFGQTNMGPPAPYNTHPTDAELAAIRGPVAYGTYGPEAPGQTLPGWSFPGGYNTGSGGGGSFCSWQGHNICLYVGIAAVGLIAMAMLSKKGKGKRR